MNFLENLKSIESLQVDILLIISNRDGRVTVCRLTVLQIAPLESIFRVLIDRNIVETKYFYQKKEIYCPCPRDILLKNSTSKTLKVKVKYA